MSLYSTSNNTWNANGTSAIPLLSCQLMFPLKPAYHASGAVLAILIISANTFVMTLFIRSRYIRDTPSNYLLFSLSTNDLLSGFSIIIHVLPYFVSRYAGCTTIKRFGEAYRMMAEMFSNFLLISAVAQLMLISSERVISIYHALRYNAIVTHLRVKSAVGIAWVLGILLILIQLLWRSKRHAQLFDRFYSILLIVSFGFVPAIVLMAQYLWMFKLIRKMTKKYKTAKERKKSLKKRKALIIYCSMFVCFLIFCVPFLLIRLLVFVKISIVFSLPEELLECFFLLRFMVSLVNPLLYTLYKRDFRKATRSLWNGVYRNCFSNNDIVINSRRGNSSERRSLVTGKGFLQDNGLYYTVTSC